MPGRKIIKNVATNWAVTVWNIGWAIALVPIYLHYLGKATYGIWILVNAVVGYYGLLDLGLRPALMRHVAKYIGHADERSLNEICNTAWIIQTTMAVLVLLVSAALAAWLPYMEGFALNEFPGAQTLLLLFGGTAALSFVGGGFKSAIGGAERFDVSNVLLLASSCVVNVGNITVLYFGGGLIEMATVLLCTRLLDTPVAAFVSCRIVPNLRFNPRLFRIARVKELFGYGIHAFGVAAGERLRFASDAIVISAFLPAASIVIFSIGNRPMTFLTEFVRGISRVLTPAFSRKEASQTTSDLAHLLVLSTRATSLLAFLGSLLLVVAGDRLLKLWLGEGFEESFLIILILVPAYLMETSLAPTGSFLLGTKGYKLISKVIIAEGIANLALSLSLIRPFGLIGVALGTAIPMIVVRLFIIPTLAGRIAGISLTTLLRECWLPAIPAVLAGGFLSIGVSRWIPGTDVFSVAAFVGLTAAAYCLCAFVTLWLRQDDLLPPRVLNALPALARDRVN